MLKRLLLKLTWRTERGLPAQTFDSVETTTNQRMHLLLKGTRRVPTDHATVARVLPPGTSGVPAYSVIMQVATWYGLTPIRVLEMTAGDIHRMRAAMEHQKGGTDARQN